MKKILIIILILFGSAAPTLSQGFYDINSINTIEITFEEENWDYLLDQLVSTGQEERLLGTVVINGVVYDSVGIRYKGNSSYKPNQVKNPLNIKLDHVIPNQDIDGYGTLKLANGFKDPSFIRESLSYEIARKYFPASLANYANVYINDTHLGLYTNVQDVDKYFMKSHFGRDDRTRIKGESIGPSGGVWEYYGQDSTSYYSKYALESGYGWQDLIRFLDTLNNHTESVEHVLNIDRHLWFMAFSNLLVNLDGPINNPQNYYLFKDIAGRFNPIPWDLNECFGVFTFHQTLGMLNLTQLQQMGPFVNAAESDYPVISKILSNDIYRKMYVAHMKTLMEENIENGFYEERGLEIQDIIDAYVQADNNKFYTYADFLGNIHNSVGGGPPPNSPVIGITQLMEARVNYISGLPDFTAQEPIISEVTASPEVVDPTTEVWITAKVEEAGQVFLGYRHRSTQAFQKTQMFDDGDHQDNASGDGIFGTSVIAGHSSIHYYIYAENDDASSYSPVRAEHAHYNVSVSGDLVINEFMADNKTAVADQDGEYDDWIELYNNGSEEISLAGFCLSDDLTEPTKWAFPDTTMAPDSYIIVWADKDEEQEGLHANFKLSGGGEIILLSDSEFKLLDEVEFGPQITDTTTGRFPNGTGSFGVMLPTFAAENTDTLNNIISKNATDKTIRIYPNPTSSHFRIKTDFSGPVPYELYSPLGKRIMTGMIRSEDQPVDLSGLSQNIYFLKIENRTYKVIKTK